MEGSEITTLSELLEIEVSTAEGWPQLKCQLKPKHVAPAAGILAEGIVRRRIGVNTRLQDQWQSRHLGFREGPVEEKDLLLFKAGLLQNLGTPNQPSPDEQLHGLVAESIWIEVASEVDAGLGIPIRVEGHDWSVTDPGGDGLTVYETSDGGFCYRLWESKYHGTDGPVRNTVNNACRQVESRSLSYLSRFSQIAQQITEDDSLANFYGRLAELWVKVDPAAGVGISVGTEADADVAHCFGGVTNHFEFELDQHQAHLHLTGDFAELSHRVRTEVWKGCGLSNGR